MNHVPNFELPVGTFRIVCKKCGIVLNSGIGDYTKGSISSMAYEGQVCPNCKGEIILETNPKKQKK